MEKNIERADKSDDQTKEATFSTRPRAIARTPNVPRPGVPVSLKQRMPVLFILILSLVLGLGGGWVGARLYNNDAKRSVSTAVKQQYVSSESELISNIAKTVGQSVVSVDVQTKVNVPTLFGGVQSSTQQSAGTGFIINSDGTILTNRHVVPKGVDKVSVTLADGTRYDDVKVIGRTSSSNPLDVAFLKITDLKGKKLSAVKLGDSSKVKVGDHVVAIGNALGQFQNTVTSGIISGYGRDVIAGDETGSSTESLTDLFQTDAAINAGNSGGPLVNINGEVIGINTAVAGNAQNIGFAIPINDAKGLVSSVLDTGSLKQAYLGVHYISLTDDLAYQYNLTVKRGAYIIPSDDREASVVSDSPAEKAGLKEKDIITKVNNIGIDQKTSLTSALARFKPGDKVQLTVVRSGKTINVSVTLGELPTD